MLAAQKGTDDGVTCMCAYEQAWAAMILCCCPEIVLSHWRSSTVIQ